MMNVWCLYVDGELYKQGMQLSYAKLIAEALSDYGHTVVIKIGRLTHCGIL